MTIMNNFDYIITFFGRHGTKNKSANVTFVPMLCICKLLLGISKMMILIHLVFLAGLKFSYHIIYTFDSPMPVDVHWANLKWAWVKMSSLWRKHTSGMLPAKYLYFFFWGGVQKCKSNWSTSEFKCNVPKPVCNIKSLLVFLMKHSDKKIPWYFMVDFWNQWHQSVFFFPLLHNKIRFECKHALNSVVEDV